MLLISLYGMDFKTLNVFLWYCKYTIYYQKHTQLYTLKFEFWLGALINVFLVEWHFFGPDPNPNGGLKICTPYKLRPIKIFTTQNCQHSKYIEPLACLVTALKMWTPFKYWSPQNIESRTLWPHDNCDSLKKNDILKMLTPWKFYLINVFSNYSLTTKNINIDVESNSPCGLIENIVIKVHSKG